MACHCGHVYIAKTLVLEHEADVDELDKCVNIPFFKAIIDW